MHNDLVAANHHLRPLWFPLPLDTNSKRIRISLTNNSPAMDLLTTLSSASYKSITCIELHTAGEPTRVILSGYPALSGSLLSQRGQAKASHDSMRKRLMLEPRGHVDMYGAILRHDTELTATGAAHMGVLFTTNDGYSTMCGHATIALGRLLVDTHDKQTFPRRDEVEFDAERKTVLLRLHAPCGLLHVTVPTNDEGSASDPTRPVSFISVPSFATAIQVRVPIPDSHRWPELGSRDYVTVDFSYGGAFYGIVAATELGFQHGLKNIDFDATNKATKLLKAAVNANPDLEYVFRHPDHDDLGFLYSIMLVDQNIGRWDEGAGGVETGLCYFANQQVDRSPTGSGVAARAALAYAKELRKVGERWTYHSLVTNMQGQGGFVGTVVEEVGRQSSLPVVHVKVEGFAYYTGTHTFVVEDTDPLGEEGFLFNELS